MVLAAMLFSIPQASADTTEDASTAQEQPPKFSLSGCSGFQMTRLQSWKVWGRQQSPRIYNNVVIDLIVDRTITPHFSIHAGVEGFMWFNTHPLLVGMQGQLQPALGENSAYLLQAENVFTFDEDNLLKIPNDVFRGEFHMGYFPYKYNPDVRNLGEYLFRSGTYPGWLRNTPFVPEARLAGLMIRTTAFDKWKNDILVTTEMEMYPFYDLSYSWISSINIGKILDIGGGVNLARFTPANSQLTTRKKDLNENTCPFYMKNLVTAPDTLIPGEVDTISGDTMFYTFTGTKVMGRLSIDLKGLLPEETASMFGKNDGIIYGEFAVLGLANQGDYYNKLSERIPVTFGVNIPRPTLLLYPFSLIDNKIVKSIYSVIDWIFKFDVLSIEGEYYTMPYPDDYRNQVQAMKQYVGGTPIPDNHIDWVEGGYSNTTDVSTNYNWAWYQHDSWKWSVYFKKTIGGHFAIIGQAARDHLRGMSNSLVGRDYDESLTKTTHWYWALRAISFW